MAQANSYTLFNIKQKDGKIIINKEEQERAWQEHLASAIQENFNYVESLEAQFQQWAHEQHQRSQQIIAQASRTVTETS